MYKKKPKRYTHILLWSRLATGWMHNIISSVTTTTTIATASEIEMERKEPQKYLFVFFSVWGTRHTQKATLSYAKTKKNCENRHEYRIESSECSETQLASFVFVPARSVYNAIATKHETQAQNIALNMAKACQLVSVVANLILVLPILVILVLTNDVSLQQWKEMKNSIDYQMNLALSQFLNSDRVVCVKRNCFLTDLVHSYSNHIYFVVAMM